MAKDPLFSNKLFGAVLLAGVLATGSGFVANLLYPPHDNDTVGYVIEGGVADASNEVKEVVDTILWGDVEILLNTAVATGGDALALAQSQGETLFKKCQSCHNIADGAPNKTGPNLWGVVDRGIAGYPDYKFSQTLIQMNDQVWSLESLNAFLHKPKQYAPGTKMSYAGLKKVTDRAALLLYLMKNQ